ncbi:MAG TPA: hypothetical protein VF614_04985 [Chthoniobacteraceae bacterium]|jgi:hypothetical protein
MDCKPSLALVLALLMAAPGVAQQVDTQIEQSRRFDQQATPLRDTSAAAGTETFDEVAPSSPGDSDLGTQAILKSQYAAKRWFIFGDLAGFHTNNVALTSRNKFDDQFLVATFGFSYQQKITDQLEADFTIRGATFRYCEFDQLNFTSIDAGAGLTYRIPQLANTTAFLRYNFNDLISEESGDEFFQNHTITAGVQKVFPLARAHAVIVGASAQWGFADPKEAERDEYGVYLGYHVDFTRALQAQVFYRSAYYRYSAKPQREDFNQNVSANLRYKLTSWASLNASASLGFNRSNQDVYDYDVANTGGGLTLEVRF